MLRFLQHIELEYNSNVMENVWRAQNYNYNNDNVARFPLIIGEFLFLFFYINIYFSNANISFIKKIFVENSMKPLTLNFLKTYIFLNTVVVMVLSTSHIFKKFYKWPFCTIFFYNKNFSFSFLFKVRKIFLKNVNHYIISFYMTGAVKGLIVTGLFLVLHYSLNLVGWGNKNNLY